jgi:hypothetical protein
MASKQWGLHVTINYPEREEVLEATYDTSEKLTTALRLLFEISDRPTSYVVTVVPGRHLWEKDRTEPWQTTSP